MSLTRLIYYSAVIGGWAAFFGWLVAEVLFFRTGSVGGLLQVAMVGAIVGGAIGTGLSLVASLANAHWKQMLARALPGLVGGAAGGAAGGVVGELLFDSVGLPRAIGWAVVGMGIGVADGIYERSTSKTRNGLIGGVLGGLIGGFLFDPIQHLVASASGMSSRATAFVILGVCIGALIGLAQVVLKHAWLTVLDGYRSGRQLIISQAVTAIGRAEHLPLPFLGPSNQDLELEHTRIVRQTDGTFLVEDNHSRIGTRLNNQPLQYPMRLNDGDVIKLGRNSVRFNERQRRSDDTAASSAATSRSPVAAPPPPAKRTPAPQKPATATGPVASAAGPSSPERKPAADLPHSPIKVASPPTEKKRGPPPPLPPPPRPKR